MENITWNKASEFCYKLSRKEGKNYRLPTEAEWEYACRTKTATKYYCGDTITPKFANFRPSHGTKPVGSYPANMWGIYDMHGNVSEWCIDEYKIGQKIMRGGSYRSYQKDLESGNRGYSSPNDGCTGNGFRVVVEIE
jgi:formylglycine-generating enzyme required for sulfatase activity